jgi:hypothetical protein
MRLLHNAFWQNAFWQGEEFFAWASMARRGTDFGHGLI